MIQIRPDWRFNCDSCPFGEECEHYGLSMAATGKYCKVIDLNNTYVTLDAPMEKALVFKMDQINEDLIPTDKDIKAVSLLRK